MKRLWSIALLAACSSNNGPHGVLVDAPPADARGEGSGSGSGSGSGAQPRTVTMHSFGATPVFAAYRDGQGAWTTATSSDGASYKISVTTDYLFVAVCTSTDGSISETEVAATTADDPNQYFACQSDNASGTFVTVTGTMQQPGTVQMVDTATGSAGPWSFSLQVPASTTQDLFATGSAAMVIQRGIAIGASGTQSVPAIDLGSGAAYNAQAITVTGLLADDTVQTDVLLETQNGFGLVSVGSDPTSVELAPSSLLQNTDFEMIDLVAINATTSRTIEVDPSTTQLALPPRLDGVTFTGASASWTTLPPANTVAFDVAIDGTTTRQDANVQISASWLAATGATSVAFDDSAPGWQAAWSFWKTSGGYVPSLAVETYSNTSNTFTSSTVFGGGAFRSRWSPPRHEPRRHRRR